MTLDSGSRVGAYDILGPLGAGGMGEVYRARDSRLQRDVAIKVLPELFALDPDRLTRFEREAQVLASLNHSNIAHVYGVERLGGSHALVMELVEGDDLSQRIARGALPLEDALPIARQVADALEAAHERGIIHRDLKPANIKIRDDGTVKVLDFGLAKAAVGQGFSPADSGSPKGLAHENQNSPTFTTPAITQMGVILGTAAYMAPEQAKGRAVDRRADIWAFGCVLYEMLTGKHAFPGEDITDTLAAIVRSEPDWSALPAGTPASIRRLLRRCLDKDAKHRLSSIGDARLELEERDEAPAAIAAPPPGRMRRWLPAAAAVGGAALTAVVFFASGATFRTTEQRPTVRLSLSAPRGTTFTFDSAEIALSPDGRMLAFSTGATLGSTKLWVRALDSLEARPLAGTEGGNSPFWSPDSREVAFFADGKLKKVSIAGGAPQVICDASDGRGGSWGRDTIVFAPSNNGPLHRVSPNGGEPVAVTTLNAAGGETGHRFPSLLPDGRTFLFAAVPSKGGTHRYQVFVASLDSSERSFLLESNSVPIYAAPGYLLFTRKNVLVAQAFDPATRTLSGEPQPLGDIVSSNQGMFAAGYAVSVSSSGGAFAYLGGPLTETKLVSFDRSGREQSSIELPTGHYTEIAVAPDGRRLALVRKLTTLEADLWIAELGRAGASRFTFGGALNSGPVWTEDGQRIGFSNDSAGPRHLLMRASNGTTPEQPLFVSPAPFKDLRDWSPDGRFAVMTQLDPKTNWDLWLLPLDGDRTPKPYLQTPFSEVDARISPDGRWMAYISDESGRFEVYVRSFPVPGVKYQVTSQGSSSAWLRWRDDGRQLAVVDADARELLTVDVQTGAEFRSDAPRRLMSLPRDYLGLDMSRDFQRVFVNIPTDGSSSAIVIVSDWLSGLQKR